MRSATSFRSKSEEEQINTTQGLEPVHVPGQFRLKIVCIGFDRVKAQDLFKERFSEQSLEVAHKTQSIVHSQRGQRILGKDMKSPEQGILLIRFREVSKQLMQGLCAAATEDYYNQRSQPRICSSFNLFKHRAADVL